MTDNHDLLFNFFRLKERKEQRLDQEDKERRSCNECLGTTKHCRYCGTLLDWLYGKPMEYASGTIHRCPVLEQQRNRNSFFYRRYSKKGNH